MSSHNKYNRKGFVLYVVCALVIGLFILIAGFGNFKSGATLQLSKNIAQEKMIIVAQAAVNESLALVKATINNGTTDIGGAVKQFWKSKKSAPAVIWQKSLSGNNLQASTSMANEFLGSGGSVKSEITIQATEEIKGPGVISYIGYIRIVSRVTCDGIKNAIAITEQHDLKITDLSYPFLDKYAFFVKSFCVNLNTNNKKFIINGVKGNNDVYSFVYFGNRNYPSCNEYENGSKDPKNPPVLLDLDFEKDKTLLAGFYNSVELPLKDGNLKQQTKGKFFAVNSYDFDRFKDNFDTRKDFNDVIELKKTYYEFIKQSYRYGSFGGILGSRQAVYDFDEDVGNSTYFRGMLLDLFPTWKYIYAYTDYNHIFPDKSDSFGATHPFIGLSTYFDYLSKNNKSRLYGGSMPEIFGEDRKTPVYIDGPCYVRFFKVGMIDESFIKYTVAGLGSAADQVTKIIFPCVSCLWSESDNVFPSKTLDKKLDPFTKTLMSHPVEFLSINNFYFGSKENIKNKGNYLSGGMKGYDAFHYIDPQLRTISNFYDTSDEFIKERVKNINGEEILDLDGISIIYGNDSNTLDLSEIKKYRGKGMIVSLRGHCSLGNLLPTDAENDYLKIWLSNGKFVVSNSVNNAKICASLISMINSSDNSVAPDQQQGGFFTNHIKTEIFGNLLIDHLFDMEDKKDFTITHDPKLFFNDYPVRVSIGAPKDLFQLDYQGKD